MKLNIDGMAQGVPGRAAAGGVFRDHRGLSSGLIVLILGLVRHFLQRFRPSSKVLSTHILVAGIGFGLS